MTKDTERSSHTPRTDALLHQGRLADYPERLRQECYLLERELAEAKEVVADWQDRWNKLYVRMEQAEQRLTEAEKDAERYKYIRRQHCIRESGKVDLEAYDRSIDAAIFEEGRKQGVIDALKVAGHYATPTIALNAIRALKEKPYLDVMDEIEIDAAIAQEKK